MIKKYAQKQSFPYVEIEASLINRDLAGMAKVFYTNSPEFGILVDGIRLDNGLSINPDNLHYTVVDAITSEVKGLLENEETERKIGDREYDDGMYHDIDNEDTDYY